MTVRQPLRARAFVVMAISATLLLAACGGGSSKPSSTPSTNGGGGSNTTTTSDSGSGGNGKCYTTPGKQTARVRFVNLYTNSTYPKGDIDVYQGYGADDACGKKLATIPFGTATDYVDVTASDKSGNWDTTAFVGGSSADDHKIITQSETWKGGEQITMVFMGSEPQAGVPAAGGGDQTFFETPNQDGTSTIAAVPGKAVLAIGAASLQYVVKDGAWTAGITGTPGCLLAVGDSKDSRTNVGGTSLLAFPVAPGSLEFSLYPSIPGTCAGTADIGPTTIDAAAGSRTLVLAYGGDAQSLRLLVLPIKD